MKSGWRLDTLIGLMDVTTMIAPLLSAYCVVKSWNCPTWALRLLKVTVRTLSTVAAKSELESFSIQDDRLDTFLRSRMIVVYQKPGLSYIWHCFCRTDRPQWKEDCQSIKNWLLKISKKNRWLLGGSSRITSCMWIVSPILRLLVSWGPAIYRIWPNLTGSDRIWSNLTESDHIYRIWPTEVNPKTSYMMPISDGYVDFLLYVNLCTFCEFHICYWTAECLWFHSSVIYVWVSMIMNSCYSRCCLITESILITINYIFLIKVLIRSLIRKNHFKLVQCSELHCIK